MAGDYTGMLQRLGNLSNEQQNLTLNEQGIMVAGQGGTRAADPRIADLMSKISGEMSGLSAFNKEVGGTFKPEQNMFDTWKSKWSKFDRSKYDIGQEFQSLFS